MRTSKIVGFSIPPKLLERFEKTIKETHKTKSEFFREMLHLYFKMSDTLSKEKNSNIDEGDIAGALKIYWDLKASKDITTIIIGLAVIIKNGEVLIGCRREKDVNVENLSWVFPGGTMESLDFAKEIKREVKEETGLEVNVKSLITARIHPDSGFKPVQVVALYFHCEPESSKKVNQKNKSEAFSEIKWVKPKDVYKYFTTSTSEEVSKFLVMIERSRK